MSISKYKADKALPCFEFFENLVTRYPAVNLNWLIGNQGEMFLDPNMKPKPAKRKASPPDLLESKNEMIALQAKSLEMMETRVKELTHELRNFRKAGDLMQEMKERKSRTPKAGTK